LPALLNLVAPKGNHMTKRSKVNVPTCAPSNNGSDVPERDSTLLRDALDRPGIIEIPPSEINQQPAPVLEIPAANLDPDQGDDGEPLVIDPALITVSIDRPGPHSWVQLFPERMLRTVLLAYKPAKDASPEFHYVIPELQRPLQRDLKQVQVHLLFDASGAGECFLWIVPESELSPYHNAVAMVRAKGDAYLHDHLFRFAKAELKKRNCDVRVRPRSPDDPVAVVPSRPLSQLLPEALKAERIVNSTAHPVYAALTAGGRLR
jgi:hypothetical protein